MVKVEVAVGCANVPMFGQRYNQGQILSLTDDQYASLPTYIKSQLALVSSHGGNATTVVPVPPASPEVVKDTNSYTDQIIAEVILKQAVPTFLIWDGSDYQPSQFKGNVERPKTFIGPQDPNGWPGVILATRDQWVNN